MGSVDTGSRSPSGPRRSPRGRTADARRTAPRVSESRYLVRRMVALVLAGLIVVGGVLAVRTLGSSFSGAGETVSATEAPADGATGAAPDTNMDAGGESSPATVPEAPVSSDTAAVTPESVAPTTVHIPTPADPARVLIIGDSDAGTFGPYLQRLLAATGVVDTTLDYKVSSGLARPDFFNWHEELDRQLSEVDPHIVVVTFGGNDAQFLADESGDSVASMPTPDSDNAEWTAEYRERVGRIVGALEDRDVVWVGIPSHVDPEVRFRMNLQNEAVKAELAQYPEVDFVDTWRRFAGRNGNYAEFVIDPRDGMGKDVRAGDGFHLNEVGAEILAIDIAQVVYERLRARGAGI